MSIPKDFDNPARLHALKVLHEIETTDTFADHVLDQLWPRVSVEDVRDRRLITTLVHGVVQWKKRLDWILDQFVKGGIKRLDSWTHQALRMGVYQLVFLDRIPDWAAIDESVELAKQMSGRGAAGLVNAVLRRIAREQAAVRYPSLENDPVLHIAVMYSHPEWIVARWIDRYGVHDTIALCQFNNTPRPVVLRVNRIRTTSSEVQRRLEAQGISHRMGRYHPFSLELQEGVDVGRLSIHQAGFVQVQDEAASLVSLLVDPQPGEYVVDACAAPGGKTTHMAELMRDQGKLLAVDIDRRRLDLLRDNCRRLGIGCVDPLLADAREPLPPPKADRVLLDAPCSGLGVLARRSDARWRKSEEDIAELQTLQKDILQAAARTVRPGGRLVYSTCTIEPEENEEVVSWFLEAHAGEYQQLSASTTTVPSELVDAKGFYRALPHQHAIDGAFGTILVRKALD